METPIWMTSSPYDRELDTGAGFRLADRIRAHWVQRVTTVPGSWAEALTWRQRRVDEQAIQLIVGKALTGDNEAFADLFREYKRDVLRVCRRMLGPGEWAEDAVSEVFLRARRALGGFDSDQPFRPWLISIAGHHCIDQLRRRSTESRIFSEAELEESNLESTAPSALVRVLAAEEKQSLGRAIEALPIRYRLPLLLRYFEDMDYEAIGKTIGVTKNQVGSLLFRGKTLLRAEVEGTANDRTSGARRSRSVRRTK